MTPPDLRSRFWTGLDWYESLAPPHGNEASAWFLAKVPPVRWEVPLTNRALQFAVDHGLEGEYRGRFAGIAELDLTEARAKAEYRSVTFPIGQILNELVVGSLLESVLHWTYVCAGPPGHRQFRGDWQFATPAGREVFVEVKSVAEPSYANGFFTRPQFVPRLHNLLKSAYRQLPEDGRATCVFIVAANGIILEIPHGIEHGDLFQAFFGDTVVKFDFNGQALLNPRMQSTFREMFVQVKKNRRLGGVFGLELSGRQLPRPLAYAIHNPFAHDSTRLPVHGTKGLHRFYVDTSGRGVFEQGMAPEAIWNEWITDAAV